MAETPKVAATPKAAEAGVAKPPPKDRKAPGAGTTTGAAAPPPTPAAPGAPPAAAGAASPPPTTPAEPKAEEPEPELTAEDEEVLTKVGEIWQPRNLLDLEARRQIAVLLTQHLGDKARQPHGRRVMREVEYRYDIAMSDLYRMLKWVRHFSSLTMFRTLHEDCATWSAVKVLLPKLEGKAGAAKKKATKRDEYQALVRQAKECLKELREKGEELQDHVAPKELRELEFEITETKTIFGFKLS